MRTPFIAANWKMNLERAAIADFCAALRELSQSRPPARIGVFPPHVYLAETVQALSGSGIAVGAQTCHAQRSGAFTGEVAARQIADVGASHVLVGHSERRQFCAETDAEARARLDAALAAGLEVIFCLGESLAERQSGATERVVTRQLQAATSGQDGETFARRVTLAYEPVWAIGTGVNASPAQAQEVHALLRGLLAAAFGARAAGATLIQYGGSVKPGNIAELMACPDVDGALVGGASLEYPSFEAIVRLGQPAPHRAGRH